MNLGVAGGTFDPVHLGHLAVAEEARRLVPLDKVIFVPAGRPYFKAAGAVSPAADRLKMLELALTDKTGFELSIIEIERPGPSYAVDTLNQLKRQYGNRVRLFYILGWDSVIALPLWQNPVELLRLCRIVAAPRPGYPKPDVTVLEKDLPGISLKTIVMDKPLVDISSSEIRERVRRGLSIDDMVSAAVAAYIKQKGLYSQQSLS
jgi:nicotinate-nucleotide adenylyltransferase